MANSFIINTIIYLNWIILSRQELKQLKTQHLQKVINEKQN